MPKQNSRPQSRKRRPNRPRPPVGRAKAVVAPRTAADPRTDGLAVKLAAEAFGTFVLVLGGCGSAVIASSFTTNGGVQVGIGLLGVALAFGLTVLVMSVAVGGVSGGHFNPAVTIGLACANRTSWRDVPAYIVAQLVGAVVAASVLFLIASGRDGFDATRSGFASNGYGTRSPGGYGLGAVVVAEVVLTAVFLAVIIAATGDDAPKALAPIAIGLTLTLIHLVAIPVDNTSVNPARSLGVALFAGPGALGQLWVFLIAPPVGGAIAGLLFRAITRRRSGLGGQGARTPAV